MARYESRNTNKSVPPVFFIIFMLGALVIGIGGLYLLLEKSKGNSDILVSQQAKDTDFPVSSPFVQPIIKTNTLELEPIAQNRQPTDLASQNINLSKIKLPSLLESDPVVREMIAKAAPGLLPWLGSDQLIRRFLIVANDFSQDYRIANHMSFLRLDEPFAIEQGDNGMAIAAKSYRRYDQLAQAVQGLDAKIFAKLYLTFRPLLLQVFSEFSYPKEVKLEAIIKKAAGEILAAPLLQEGVGLLRPSTYYKFADPQLEALSPVQKQMIRMGAQNTLIIQTKLREFLVELGKLNFSDA